MHQYLLPAQPKAALLARIAEVAESNNNGAKS